MKNRIITIGFLITSFGALASPAFAQTLPTMNQPDNGFFEGPSPEWAIIHSTDSHGTEVHRQYHRDGAQKLLDWYQKNRSARGTNTYDNTNRIIHQVRNENHRGFHSAPINP